MKSKGTKEEVWNNLAKKTSGGLTKDDLIVNANGKIVSKKKSLLAMKNMQNGRGLCAYCNKIYKPKQELKFPEQIEEEDIIITDPTGEQKTLLFSGKKIKELIEKEDKEKLMESKKASKLLGINTDNKLRDDLEKNNDKYSISSLYPLYVVPQNIYSNEMLQIIKNARKIFDSKDKDKIKKLMKLREEFGELNRNIQLELLRLKKDNLI